jgi:hypothetical protein
MKLSTWLRRKTDRLEHLQKALLAIWGCHHEIRQFLLRFRVFRQLDHAAYWLRTHTWDRYHMLDISNRRNGYTWGWMDRSEGILFANMAMLVDFVEKERAFEVINWESDEGHIEAAKELREIYEWWTHLRKIEHDEYERRSDAAYKDFQFTFTPLPGGMQRLDPPDETPEQRKERNAIWAEEDRLYQKDTDMMIRLIKVRGAMWT